MTYTVDGGGMPYTVKFTEIGHHGDPLAFVNGYRIIGRGIKSKKPKKDEEWYVYTLHRSDRKKFIIVYPLCTKQAFENDPSLIPYLNKQR